MNADYALEWCRRTGGPVINMRLVTSGRRRYVADLADGTRHDFAHSVTQITSNRWNDQDTSFENEAMRIGTNVHEGINNWQTHGHAGFLHTDEAACAFQQFLAWEEEQNDTVAAKEALVWNQLWDYAGTLDNLRFKDGEYKLMDFKTGSTYRPHYAAQLAGYDLALQSVGHPPCDKASVLLLPKDGNHWEEHIVWDTPEVRAAWSSVFLTAAKFKRDLEMAKALGVTVRRSRLASEELWEKFAS